MAIERQRNRVVHPRDFAHPPRGWTGVLLLVAAAFAAPLAAQTPYRGAQTDWFSEADLQAQLEGRAPGMPYQPPVTSRPATWPGGAAAAPGVVAYPQTAYPQTAAPVARTAQHNGGFAGTAETFVAPNTDLEYPRVEAIDSAAIIARVGGEVILAGEVRSGVEDMLRKNADKIPPGQEDTVREMLMRRQLKELVETKAVFVDVKRNVPAESFPQVIERAEKLFEAEQLPKIIERAGAKSRADLENMLDELGSSVLRQRQNFAERVLAQQWLGDKARKDHTISLAELKDYYNTHPEEFAFPAGVRYEQILVRYENHDTRQEAHNKLVTAGNLVLGGTPFADVAKKFSEGDTAEDGGEFDWTEIDSIVSDSLRHALATLPLNAFSQIIEDFQGYQIVRVLERRQAGLVPFLEAQVDIRKKIELERKEAAMREVIEEIIDRTPIWTIYGDLFADERLAEEAAANRR